MSLLLPETLSNEYVLRVVSDARATPTVIAEKKGFFTWFKSVVWDRSSYTIPTILSALLVIQMSSNDEHLTVQFNKIYDRINIRKYFSHSFQSRQNKLVEQLFDRLFPLSGDSNRLLPILHDAQKNLYVTTDTSLPMAIVTRYNDEIQGELHALEKRAIDGRCSQDIIKTIFIEIRALLLQLTKHELSYYPWERREELEKNIGIPSLSPEGKADYQALIEWNKPQPRGIGPFPLPILSENEVLRRHKQIAAYEEAMREAIALSHQRIKTIDQLIDRLS